MHVLMLTYYDIHVMVEAIKVNIFICPSRDGPYYVIGYGGRAGVRTITLVLYIGSLPNLATWKGKNPIYFGVMSKVRVTITINIIFDNRVVST